MKHIPPTRSSGFNPLQIGSELIAHRDLIVQLARRDVLLKYRGSYLGIAWSFLYPLLLLVVFTFVFDKVLGARWPQPNDRHVPVVLVMYCGLIVFNIFAEISTAAPRLIPAYQSYVKKIVFPTQVLPIVLVITAFIHATINVLILMLVILIAGHGHPTLLLTPIVMLPMVFFALGIAWILAATGVFIRDLAHVMPVVAQILMFLCPVFYSARIVPDYMQWFYRINPLSVVIEDFRRVALWGHMPHWESWAITLAISIVVTFVGYAFFFYGKEEFADVL